MAQLFFNNARGVVAESVSSGDTTLVLKDHANLPSSLGEDDYFLLTLFADSSRYGERIEVVKVTALEVLDSGNLSLTVDRGYEFGAQVRVAGDRAEARLTAQTLRNIIAEMRAYADTRLSDLIDSAPGTLDTLNDLAEALGNDPNFAATVSAQIGEKLDSSAYTADDVLNKLLTVDTDTAGINASTLKGLVPGDSAGNLMKVGAFGVGNRGIDPVYPLPSFFDDAREVPSGNYRFDNQVQGSPLTAGGTVRVSHPSIETVLLEIRYWYSALVSRTYLMTQKLGESGDWLPAYDGNNIVGTVLDHEDGTPKGGLIERGSNSNGDYLKFADGNAFCRKRLLLPARDYLAGKYALGDKPLPMSFPDSEKVSAWANIVARTNNPDARGGFKANTKVRTSTLWGYISIESSYGADSDYELELELVAWGVWK